MPIMQIGFIIVLFVMIIYLYHSLKQTRNDAVLTDFPTLSRDNLLKYAFDLPKKHEIIKGHNSISFLINRMEKNYRYIAMVYKKVNGYLSKSIRVPDSAEWLLDNFYIIEKQTKELRISIRKAYFSRLPVMKSGVYRGYPRVFVLMHELVSHSDGVVEQDTLVDFINEYQKTLKLSDAELWSLETMLRIALIENVRRFCEAITDTHTQYKSADMLARKLWVIRDDKIKLRDTIAEEFRYFDISKSAYFECLVKFLRNCGNESRIIFEVIDARLSEIELSAEHIVQIEHQKQAGRHISIGNAITSLRFILNLNFTEIFEELSVVEHVLSSDPSGIYPLMDKASKNYYRTMVEKLAKKHDLSEVEIAKMAASSAREYDGDNEKKKHLGYYLINDTPKRKGYAYIWNIILLTLILDSALWYLLYTTGNTAFSIIAAAMALIPLSDIVVNFCNYVITRRVKAVMLPRLELAEGIPDEGRTLVVISSILPNEKAATELANKLEIYKNANNEKNILFGILSDFPDKSEEITEHDEKALARLEYEMERLNEKYGGFYLFHRRRLYNAANKRYMGYERKRGALCELNKFLLTGNTGSFCSITGSRRELSGVKYVITLDGDTQLMLGSAKKLIGTMLHPLNRPEIDLKLKRVIKGYGVLQPKIGLDIESANKSLFSKIFAGQGGVDPYSFAVSDVYQDLFGEGIFTGKGIYDVAAFDKVLSESIPDNTVLSHDLLEGSYIRCGLVSDVEFSDGFPWRYNSYSLRSHRWIRGDWQIIGWLFSYVKNAKGRKVKNPLNTISRWKIFDNLRRSVLEVFLLALLTASLLCGSFTIPLTVCLAVISSSLLIQAAEWFINGSFLHGGVKYHSTIIFGIQGVLYQVILTLMFLPHKAFLALDAIIRSLYRMLISRRRMLQWVTAEEGDRILGNNILCFYIRMYWSVITGIVFITVSLNTATDILGGLWILAPIVAYYLSIPSKEYTFNVSDEDRKRLKELAARMWKYFEDFAGPKDNYLPADNYQENPPNGIARRTSPTNIGMLLITTLAAYDFGFISLDEMLNKLENTIETIKKLDKWNGHLYNWYNTQTLELLRPRYISTVDNGNYIVYLITLKEGLKNIQDEAHKLRIDNIIDFLEATVRDTKFSHLYDHSRKLFTIGFNCEDEKLTRSYYDLLASEARQVSYVAIAAGEIEKEHWFELGRTLTTSDNFRGLVSWTGTMFEYLMPLLVMKNIPNTLLDETYKFVIYCQKKYGRQRRVPWGTSESGFNAFDIDLNYQYKAFGVPELGLKRGLVTDMVVAPYATIMALMVDGHAALSNIDRLSDMKVIGKYGFYEAVDYTPGRTPYNAEYGVVKSYMVHHLGMSLLAIDNFLNGNIMQKRFHSDIKIKAAEELLKERIPTKVIITKDNKEDVLPLEPIEIPDDEVTRDITEVDLNNPNVQVLSNGRMSVVLSDTGAGYTRYKHLLLNRFRRDTISEIYGNFIFVTDVRGKRSHGAYLAPLFDTPDEYHVVMKPHLVEYFRRDGDIETHTEITVSAEDDCEIRSVSVTNRTDEVMLIDVTGYQEVTLSTYEADIAHKVFSNLFVQTEYVKEYGAIIAVRRPRSGEECGIYAAYAVYTDSEIVGEIEYETDRCRFIGRGRDITNPIVLGSDMQLSQTVGAVLDPCMAFKVRIPVEPRKTVRARFVTAIGDDREELLARLNRYRDEQSFLRCAEMAHLRCKTENKYLGFEPLQQKNYLKMLPFILLSVRMKNEREYHLARSRAGIEGLWQYGISGDHPIILLIVEGKNLDMIRQVLYAHEFFRIKGITVDLCIVSAEEKGYMRPVNQLINEIISISHAREMRNVPGGVFVLSGISDDELSNLYAIARVVLSDKAGEFEDQLEALVNRFINTEIKKFPLYGAEHVDIQETAEEPLEFFNGFGGFAGREYVIRLKNGEITPMPWINVIANPRFGFIATEMGGGYTYAENSRENRLTPWSNDIVSDPAGEKIYILDNDYGNVFSITAQPVNDNGEYVIKHGLGYTEYSHSANGVTGTQTVFAALNDTVKLTLLKLSNKTEKKKSLTVVYYTRAVLGVSDELTERYLCTEIDDNDIIMVKNNFNRDFPGRVMFAGANMRSYDYTCDRSEFFGRSRGNSQLPEGIFRRKLSRRIGSAYDPCTVLRYNITIDAGAEKELVLMLGQGKSEHEVYKLCDKFSNAETVHAELESVKEYWIDKTSQLQVLTPDKATNLLLNSWLMYQNISCRIMGRTAFYQSGGAYGFRDQLQDMLAVLHTDPAMVKRHIILAASHQFVEGDVQHWWHPCGNPDTNAHKGVRTRFSDDLLWLVYVTCKYIEVTHDYSILEEEAHFIEGEILAEGVDERYFIPRESNVSANIYEHCVRAVERSLKFGERGLPLMGSGDWNDGMSTVGNKGAGESVWLAWFIIDILSKFKDLCVHAGDRERLVRYESVIADLKRSIEENAWDGSWYRRAYFDDGTPLGSNLGGECKIDSLAQSWAVISGAGDAERTKIAMNSLKANLVNKEAGIIKLLSPPFGGGDLKPGYIKGYVPGVRENGGQYTHAACWTVMASAMLGNGDEAFELYSMLNPVNHSRTPFETSVYKAEPYVIAADVYSTPPHVGRGGWSWYTGASGWYYTVGIEYILGIKRRGDSLFISPCVPSAWQEYSVLYKHNAVVYTINVRNPNRKSGVSEEIEIKLDGTKRDINITLDV